MMRFFKSIIGFLLMLSMLLSFCGCGNLAYKNAIKNYKTETKYVGVRQNLTLVSNVYDSVDLTEYGVSPNAYFLCGNADYIYFGVQNGRNQQNIVVQEYSIADRTTRQCSEFDYAYRVQSVDGENFYYFVITEESFLGLNKTHSWRVIKFEKDAKTGVTVHEEEIGSSYPNLNVGDAYIANYMSEISSYRWERFPGISSRRENICLSFGDLWYHPFNATSEDKVWNMIPDQYVPLDYVRNVHFYQPNEQGVAVICLIYEDHYNYFEYPFGGEPKFLFAAEVSGGGFQGLYVIE